MIQCVHIVKNALPECTGISRIVSSLAKHSGAFGYEISVLFLGDGPLVATMQHAGIDANTVAWEGSGADVAGAWRTLLWLRQRRPAIVHLHHGGRLAGIVCRLAGCRALVRHVHSLPPATENAAKSTAALRPADAIIGCSKAVADRLSGLNPQVIYAGLDSASEPVPLDPGIGPLKLGVLSRLDPGKGIETVIEATARLALGGVDVETQIAGDGPSEFISSLHRLAARLRVSDRVQFLGWRSDIERLFASWHLFLMPSLAEGFPLSALEAMMSARPIVASRVGGLCELVVDGVTGRLIPPQDAESLARCIAELAGDRQKLVQMGIAGRHRAQHEFSVERMAQSTTALYDSLLHRSTSNPISSNNV